MDRLTIRTLFLTLTSDDERLRCFFMAAIFSLSTTSFGVKKWLALLRHALLVQDQGCGEGGRERGRKAGDGEVVVWRWGSGGVEMGSGGVEMGPHLFLHLLHDQLLHPGLGTCLVTQAMLRYKMTGRHIAKCNSSYHIQ